MPSKPLTDLEVAQIVNVLDSPQERALVVLGIKTGYRISELLSLNWSDITDLNGAIVTEITVRRADMKGKQRSRSVKLHEQAKQALRQYIESEPYRPTSKLFPMSRFTAHRIVKRAVAKAGLTGRISCHSMRKAFGMSVYTRSGNNLKAAQLALGHKNISSTGHYLSVDRDTIDQLILTS